VAETDGSNELADQTNKATVLGNRKDDGTLAITFGEADMEAKADFYPPSGDGQPISPDYIAAVLERLNITYGVKWDAIQENALECNLNRKPVHGVVIAAGDPPVEEVSAYYEINPAFRKWPQMPDGDVPRVDYRELSPFVLVKKGQVLAKRREAKSGADGKNVHGEPIPHKVSKPASAESGPNTREENGAIVSTCQGRLIENGAQLSVSETLEVKGAVGYKTGHIIFPGDVIIDGNVADGFKVYSGGSIVSKQTFDATDAVAKKDLIVAGGIVGRGKASVKVGGNLRAKFIQNCRVACRGGVTVGAAVVNSRIYTMEKLDLGDKGRIIGGEVFAIKGVRAAGIGAEKSVQTKLHCGVDFTVQQELDRINDHLRVLSTKLRRLRELPPEEAEKVPRKAEFEKRATEEMAALSSRASDLLAKLDADERAVVEVSGEVSSGTLIEICHIAYFTDQVHKKVRFRLDKEHGRLIHEPL